MTRELAILATFFPNAPLFPQPSPHRSFSSEPVLNFGGTTKRARPLPCPYYCNTPEQTSVAAVAFAFLFLLPLLFPPRPYILQLPPPCPCLPSSHRHLQHCSHHFNLNWPLPWTSVGSSVITASCLFTPSGAVSALARKTSAMSPTSLLTSAPRVILHSIRSSKSEASRTSLPVFRRPTMTNGTQGTTSKHCSPIGWR